MEAKAAQAWIDPYLDGSLDPSAAARFERLLLDDAALGELFEARKAFRSFLERALAAVEIPEGFEDRVRARWVGLNEEHPKQAGLWIPRWRRLAAAILIACCSLVAYQVLCPPMGLCRYVAAFAHEHRSVVEGRQPLVVSTGDSERLLQYAERTAAPGWTRLPEMAGCRPVGAGKAVFSELARLGAPEGLFLRYEDEAGRPLVLFVHAWPAERPTVHEVEFCGTRYWVSEEAGVDFVGWLAPDGVRFYSLTGEHGVPELLRKAASIRTSLSPDPGILTVAAPQ